MCDQDKFDLLKVHDNFLSALHEDDDVKMDLYLASYEELNKFFTLMGTMFGFVSKDLKQKMDILTEFLKDSNRDNFVTVKSMLQYEKENQLLYKNGYTSGSRTLLRLHRGLDFIREFLKAVGELDKEHYTSGACREAYDKTLARYHPFLIKKTAHLAMYTMPNKEHLLKRVCGKEENINKAIEVLPKTLEITETVFIRIEQLYTLYDLHSLP